MNFDLHNIGPGGSLAVFCLFVLINLIALSMAVFWFRMLAECLKNVKLPQREKIAWTIAMVVMPVVGSVVYFLLEGRNQTSITRA